MLAGSLRRGLAMAAAGLAMVVASGSVAADPPIRIGAALSLTGTYAKLGQYQREGYEFCAVEVNEKGGVLGRPVEFVVYDDQSMPATAVRLYERLITEDGVEAVMGPYSPSIAEAAASVTEKYRKVMMSPLAATASMFQRGRKYVVTAVAPAEAYLGGLMELAAAHGLRTVAILNEDSLFPKSAAIGAVTLAGVKGLEVVFREAYPRGHLDFAAALVKLRALDPDVIAAATSFDDAVAITRQMRDLNVNPRMFGVTVGGDLPEFHAALKQTAEYVYGATPWEATLPHPRQREFLEGYRKRFGREPVYHATASYAGCAIYLEAVRRADSLDSEGVRAELLALEVSTPFGDYKVDADGMQVGHRVAIIQWQDGHKVTVWPGDLASGPARFPTPPWIDR